MIENPTIDQIRHIDLKLSGIYALARQNFYGEKPFVTFAYPNPLMLEYPLGILGVVTLGTDEIDFSLSKNIIERIDDEIRRLERGDNYCRYVRYVVINRKEGEKIGDTFLFVSVGLSVGSQLEIEIVKEEINLLGDAVLRCGFEGDNLPLWAKASYAFRGIESLDGNECSQSYIHR